MAESYTADQIDAFKECFSLYDADCDGLITKSELAVVMRSLGESVTDLEIGDLIKQLGKDKVKFPEFLKLMAQHHSKNIDTEKEILAAFIACDQTKTGQISREELQHYMTETGDKLTKMEFEHMLRDLKMDTRTKYQYTDLVRAVTH